MKANKLETRLSVDGILFYEETPMCTWAWTDDVLKLDAYGTPL